MNSHFIIQSIELYLMEQTYNGKLCMENVSKKPYIARQYISGVGASIYGIH